MQTAARAAEDRAQFESVWVRKRKAGGYMHIDGMQNRGGAYISMLSRSDVFGKIASDAP